MMNQKIVLKVKLPQMKGDFCRLNNKYKYNDFISALRMAGRLESKILQPVINSQPYYGDRNHHMIKGGK